MGIDVRNYNGTEDTVIRVSDSNNIDGSYDIIIEDVFVDRVYLTEEIK